MSPPLIHYINFSRLKEMRIPPKQHLLQLNRIVDSSLDREQFLRMDKNENLMGFSEDIVQDILKLVTSDFLIAYPEVEPLYQKLSECLNLPQNQIFSMCFFLPTERKFKKPFLLAWLVPSILPWFDQHFPRQLLNFQWFLKQDHSLRAF